MPSPRLWGSDYLKNNIEKVCKLGNKNYYRYRNISTGAMTRKVLQLFKEMNDMETLRQIKKLKHYSLPFR